MSELSVYQKAQKIVEQEVLVCVSSLIDDLVSTYWRATQAESNPFRKLQPLRYDEEEILELHRPVEHDGEEYEIFEHWIITHWLAEELKERGERTVELSGLHIWCRTTTGQQIAADNVIEEIGKARFGL